MNQCREQDLCKQTRNLAISPLPDSSSSPGNESIWGNTTSEMESSEHYSIYYSIPPSAPISAVTLPQLIPRFPGADSSYTRFPSPVSPTWNAQCELRPGPRSYPISNSSFRYHQSSSQNGSYDGGIANGNINPPSVHSPRILARPKGVGGVSSHSLRAPNISPSASTSRDSVSEYVFCEFCEGCKKPESVVRGHNMKDSSGGIVCPTFLSLAPCTKCISLDIGYGSDDPRARHTPRYCPNKEEVRFEEPRWG